MTEKALSPLRQRLVKDMSIRGIGEKAQSAHIRGVKDLTNFLGRSPNTATSEDLRNYQLKMKENDVSASTFNSRIVALRFFFGVTCSKEEMKRYMQFQRKPAGQPVVLSVEEVGYLLTAVPGPGLKFLAALGISYGASLGAAEVCNLRFVNIDRDRMIIHIEHGKNGKDRKAMLSSSLLDLLRDYWREAWPEGWLFPGKSKINLVVP